MSAKSQVVLSSDLNGEIHSVCVWDLISANTLVTYKSVGVVGRHCLDVIKDQLIISSVKDSPIINVWSFERKDQMQLKIICPNKVNAIKVTKDGKYCLVAINTSLHIWQTSTGNLLSVIEKHYQKISCIAITSDSSYFVSAGEDGLAMVWSLTECIAFGDLDSTESTKEPIHKWSDHTNGITDVHLGLGGIQTFCITCSSDQTCRIYELFSGVLMTTIVFETPLWTVVMDSVQSCLYVGGNDSNIYETKLYEKPNISSEKQIKPQFVGHESAVTCLSLSIDGLALISGSNDNSIKIWHIISKQCMRTIANRGPVSNVLVLPYPSGLFLNEKTPNVVIKPFKRTLINNIMNSELENEFCIEIRNDVSLTDSLSFMEGFDVNDISAPNELDISSENVNETEDMRRELNELKEINSKIYNYSIDSVFKAIP